MVLFKSYTFLNGIDLGVMWLWSKNRTKLLGRPFIFFKEKCTYKLIWLSKTFFYFQSLYTADQIRSGCKPSDFVNIVLLPRCPLSFSSLFFHGICLLVIHISSFLVTLEDGTHSARYFAKYIPIFEHLWTTEAKWVTYTEFSLIT